nr:immunoglobulin heavy chain junction region [Macaca mulatta]MOY22020.1 immunoglobulin heavy chain junction region [Macaca mulatta]MOY22029.1 immunoglobulin heavy chain junction region [Macaca mulatta]MOY22299.1 immunoglobulin heavy chain junction region [Macaca mulatta]MOY22860.1 immunoglobulin heavy chain junction region [Macaca mulatta]
CATTFGRSLFDYW